MARSNLTYANGAPVADNLNIMTAGLRGPALLQDIWLVEKLAHSDREVIPERRMHAKGSGAHGTFTVTHDISRFTKARLLCEIGRQTPVFVRFSTVAGGRGAADAERDFRGFAVKFHTEEGNRALVGNNMPVFFFRDPLRSPDLNHAVRRDPRTGLCNAEPRAAGGAVREHRSRDRRCLPRNPGSPRRDLHARRSRLRRAGAWSGEHPKLAFPRPPRPLIQFF